MSSRIPFREKRLPRLAFPKVTDPTLVTDVRGLGQLLELIASQDSLPVAQRFYHQMERKGGRQPSLRLRFGKRAEGAFDPDVRLEADKMSSRQGVVD